MPVTAEITTPVVAVGDDATSASTYRVVDDFLTKVSGRLLEGVAAHAADDVSWSFPYSLTGGKPWTGKETVLRRLERVLTNFVQSTIEVTRRVTIVSGTEASVEFDLTAKGANGYDYANTYVFFFTLRDDKIVAVREYMDTQVVAQLLA